MKMIRKWMLLVLCLLVAFLFAACSLGNDKGRTDLGSDTEISVAQEEPQDVDETAEEPEKKEEKEEKADDEPKELSDEYVDLDEEEDEDPANADPTIGGDDDQATDDDLQRRYVGTWTLKGLEFRDGSFEDAGKCTVEIMRDGTYTMKGKLDGEKVDRKGTWTINEKKKLVMDEKDKLGVNDEGYLLMYSGQRDGKGSKLYYAFQRN